MAAAVRPGPRATFGTSGSNPACAGISPPATASPRPRRDQPAGAGTTRRRRYVRLWWRDQPRGCREQSSLFHCVRGRAGPTSRVRGADHTDRHHFPPPADQLRRLGGQPRDRRGGGGRWGPTPHARGPRVRGCVGAHHRGTTPHARGSLGDGQARQDLDGTNPAGAGAGVAGSTLREPRGPTPRARGPQCHEHPRHEHGGTYPACAGAEGRRALQLLPPGTIPAGAGSRHPVKRWSRGHRCGCDE
ncbi:hypothetical protein YWIDRAFT_07099 [Streptomyces sp. SceaMP-e96]|nr:hypothetical protein YWIDRAFT_07099 [Streptomyces sp. SceaMP-e96]